MWKTLLFLTVASPFLVFELLRFYTAHQTCKTVYAENDLLLSNVLCADAWQRHIHGTKQDAACKLAQTENLVSPFSCAWKSMWKEGEPYRLWLMITESYWMLAVIIVPCLLLTIWLMFWSWNERAHRSQHAALQKDMYRETLKLVGSMRQTSLPALERPVYKEEEEDNSGEFIRVVKRRHQYQ